MPDLDPVPVLSALASDPRLRVYLRDGGIEAIPAKRSRRLLLLDQIAQAFEPGVRYPERDVSLFLGGLHPDYASLRRYLVAAGPLTDAPAEGMAILRLPGTGQAGHATLLATLDDASVVQGLLAVTVRPWQVMLQAQS